MEKRKGVCIGAGYFSQFHFEAWQRLDDVEILAVCDNDRKKAEEACKRYGLGKAYTDVAEMFHNERPDFVDIITPPDTHLHLCKMAIEHNIDIICQKPLAPTFEEAEQMVALIKKSGVRMMVHENFRFMPWYRELKKLLEAKVVGEKLHSINLRMRMGDGWQEDAYMNRQPYFREMERLLIYETGVHFVDVFHYLGGAITRVYARLRTLNGNIKGEDFAWVQVDFENGMLGLIDANRFNENTAEDARLTFGNVLIEGNKGSLRLYDDGSITLKPLGEPESPHEYQFEKVNFSGDCVFNTQKHFVECLISGDVFETDVSGYLRNLMVQDKIYESNEKGIPLAIE